MLATRELADMLKSVYLHTGNLQIVFLIAEKRYFINSIQYFIKTKEHCLFASITARVS